jgi:hypothetical protein
MTVEATRYVMPDGSVIRGYAYDGPELEIATVQHRLEDGSVLWETIVRRVETPAPVETAPQAETPSHAG